MAASWLYLISRNGSVSWPSAMTWPLAMISENHGNINGESHGHQL